MYSSWQMTHVFNLEGNNREFSKHEDMLLCERTLYPFCRICHAPSDRIKDHKGHIFVWVICLHGLFWQNCQPFSQIFDSASGRGTSSPLAYDAEQAASVCSRNLIFSEFSTEFLIFISLPLSSSRLTQKCNGFFKLLYKWSALVFKLMSFNPLLWQKSLTFMFPLCSLSKSCQFECCSGCVDCGYQHAIELIDQIRFLKSLI